VVAVRAKLRKDLLELAGYTDDRLPWEAGVLASVAGRSLLVENVTVHAVTLQLPRTVWRSPVSGAGSAVFGTTLLTVPHTWLEVDVTKVEWVTRAGPGGIRL
jgi:hypothetical protein